LRRTYSYEPVVLTSAPPSAELTNGWVFCDVKSWLTGRRLVSLPFSDHCDPLIEKRDDLPELLKALADRFRNARWRNVQVRPQQSVYLNPVNPADSPPMFLQCNSYFIHKLDLRPELAQIYGQFDRDSIQRKIRRAERERLTYKDGRSETFIDQFYRLFLVTRRRHKLPPQPIEWFRNLLACMAEKAKIRVCYRDEKPIAAMITLAYKQVTTYKYGCSDAQFHNLGAMPYLFWRVIREAKHDTLEFDLGRSDRDNVGLTRFKENLGGRRSLIHYWSYPQMVSHQSLRGWKARRLRSLVRYMPDGILAAAGKVLYRHIA
jgi:hypothetical protein